MKVLRHWLTSWGFSKFVCDSACPFQRRRYVRVSTIHPKLLKNKVELVVELSILILLTVTLK